MRTSFSPLPVRLPREHSAACVTSVRHYFIQNMQADTLNCPMCGAPVASDATKCEHCGAPLASVVCSSCFSMMFAGSKFCPHCGAPAATTAEVPEAGLTCPRCGVAMKAIQVGGSTLRECSGCEGFWVERTAFEKLCAEEQRHAAALGQASVIPPSPAEPLEKIRYIPCPQCGTRDLRELFGRHRRCVQAARCLV